MAVKNRELLPRSADSADKLIRKLTPGQKDTYIQDSTATGLVLRVTPRGTKIWHLRYTGRRPPRGKKEASGTAKG